jgi:cytochrome o ubiquinol oxidase subunit IV
MHSSLISRVIGYISSLILTFGAFFVIAYSQPFHFDIKIAISIILVLACLQASVQSIFFLNVLSEKGPRWNLLVYASTLSVIVIIIFFSIWIMEHLDRNMMPWMFK